MDKIDANWMYDEVIDTEETEIIEENIYVDEEFIKNKSLVRIDMNIIQYPIFSKNTKRKTNQIIKYYFNKNRDTYITVTPASGNYIPGEAEEKIFITLMKIMKAKGMPRRFIVTCKELKEELNLNTRRYPTLIKEALLRLSSTNYNFKNTMYSSEEKAILNEEIQTSIMSVKILNLKESKNSDLKKGINDNRVKEVYEISISDYFYNNIMAKGYLVYNSDILLNIETSTARTIYMLIEKLRFHELYLKIDAMFLIKRIPLKFSKAHLSRTIQILSNNLQELKNKNLITSFNFIKESTWEKSEIEIYFNPEMIQNKQERFYNDLNDFRKISTTLSISETEHQLIKNNVDTEISQEKIEDLYNLLPLNAQKLKSMRKTLLESIEKYGIEKVKRGILYMKSQKKLTNPRAYFLKTLENNWAEDIVLEEKKSEKNSHIEEAELISPIEEKNYEREILYYNSLSNAGKKSLEEAVYKDYIQECGGIAGKIQQIAFNNGKESLVCKYIIKNKLIGEEDKIEEISTEELISPSTSEVIEEKKDSPIEETNVLENIEEFNTYVNNFLKLYGVMLNFDENKILQIKREILKELGVKFIMKKVTLEEINATLLEKVKI
ncbi:hypothetical protein [Cetobacterium sp. SF1]|uniref:hypothetical protein n=1 Tax=Cetobacterium sp. SF1 TaxID=3417654 RepID=UPI003CFA65BC